jgi:predicted CxxxxCH...CXXCH cytochrome family protein
MNAQWRQLTAVWLACSAIACAQERERAGQGPVYRGDIAVLLADRCAGCHGGDAGPADAAAGDGPAAAYRVDSYLGAIGCTQNAPTTPVVSGADGGPALLAVLEREDHDDLLDGDERARLREWIEHGTPLQRGGVHEPGVLDPRSAEWHGALASADRFGPLFDSSHPGACGRCHEGTPARPAGVSRPAAGAPACTDCHKERDGVAGCGTCHGDGAARAYPPRDACLFGSGEPDAHPAHLQSALRGEPLRCGTCHPQAGSRLRAEHGDGEVDVQFDLALAGADAAYGADGSCAVSCHDRGGARPQPRWSETGALGCGDCHGAPPDAHYSGACSDCHAEANADGNALHAAALHLNARVDVGDGSGRCGQCHGAGDDPLPRTPSHLLHRGTLLTAAIACSECHEVPQAASSDGHFDREEASPAEVRFGPRARGFGRSPSYEPESRTCRQVACHGAGLPDGIERALRWDERAGQTCDGCHGLPPAQDHPREPTCASVPCHGSEVSAGGPMPLITEAGRAVHIDGDVDVAGR